MPLRLLQRLNARLRSNLHGRYPSYVDALARCIGDGYEDSELVDIVASKTIAYRQQMQSASDRVRIGIAESPLLLAISMANRKSATTSVVDIGGACGAHYYTARSFFGGSIDLAWHVIETPAMVAAARRTLLASEVRFSDTIAALRDEQIEPDLVVCSGVLQYLPDPLDTLRELLDSRFRFLLITRQPVAENAETYFTVQMSRFSANGPGRLPLGRRDGGVKYPMAIIPRTLLEGALTSRSALLGIFGEEGVLFHRGTGYLTFSSYLLRGSAQ